MFEINQLLELILIYYLECGKVQQKIYKKNNTEFFNLELKILKTLINEDINKNFVYFCEEL